MKAYYQHELEEERIDERTGDILPAGKPAIRIVRNGDGGRLTTSYQKFSTFPVSPEQDAGYEHFMTTEYSIPEWEEQVGWYEMGQKRDAEVQERLQNTINTLLDETQKLTDQRDDLLDEIEQGIGVTLRLKISVLLLATYALAVTLLYATGAVLK